MHSYHVTVHLPGGSRRVHSALCHDSAQAAERAKDLYPTATRYDVHRLVCILTGATTRGTTPDTFHAGRPAA